MTEFNEVGTVVGTKSIGILDSNNIITDVIAVNENETAENIQNFMNVLGGFSYVDIPNYQVSVGYRVEGSEFIAPEPVLPQELQDLINSNTVVDEEALAAKQAAFEAADRLDGLTE